MLVINEFYPFLLGAVKGLSPESALTLADYLALPSFLPKIST